MSGDGRPSPALTTKASSNALKRQATGFMHCSPEDAQKVSRYFARSDLSLLITTFADFV
jgi:hypothetical protein